MSNIDTNEEEYDNVEESSFGVALDGDDFAFVISSSGELKAVYMPQGEFEVPDSVMRVFAALGIDPTLMMLDGESHTTH